MSIHLTDIPYHLAKAGMLDELFSFIEKKPFLIDKLGTPGGFIDSSRDVEEFVIRGTIQRRDGVDMCAIPLRRFICAAWGGGSAMNGSSEPSWRMAGSGWRGKSSTNIRPLWAGRGSGRLLPQNPGRPNPFKTGWSMK